MKSIFPLQTGRKDSFRRTISKEMRNTYRGPNGIHPGIRIMGISVGIMRDIYPCPQICVGGKLPVQHKA